MRAKAILLGHNARDRITIGGALAVGTGRVMSIRRTGAARHRKLR